jgi:aldose sugar dehydrogenase
MKRRALAAALFLSIAVAGPHAGVAAQEGPTVVDGNLRVTTIASGIALPTSIAFLGPDDLLVLEKDTGRVLRIHDEVTSTVLDLSVNNFSERGLLGIALHPDFPADPGVYLFWTCRAVAAPDADPFLP